MRLEGRRTTAGTAQKSRRDERITRLPVGRPKCTVDYICPPDWCHAIRDVASASEPAEADELPRRSVTMSPRASCRCRRPPRESVVSGRLGKRLRAAVLKKPTTPDTVLAAVRTVASL